MEIEFLSPEVDIDPENDNVDVLLRLDDGREYLFLVATPNNIYCSNVERAIAALLEEPQWLGAYGTLQVGV